MAVRNGGGFFQRQHPVDGPAGHFSYALWAEYLHGCFLLDPQVLLVRECQTGILRGLNDVPTRMIDGHYGILASRGIPGAARNFDTLLFCSIAISSQSGRLVREEVQFP